MASCEKKMYQPSAVITMPPLETEFVLRLTETEATILHAVLGKIGGQPKGPRSSIDAISIALDEVGIKFGDYKVEVHQSVFFPGSYLGIEKGGTDVPNTK